MSQATVAFTDSSWGVFTNPARLSRLGVWQVGSSYSKLFGLDQLAYSVISAGGPLNDSSGLALGLTSFGTSPYQENQLFLGGGATCLQYFQLGAAARLAQVKIGSQQPASGFGLDLGLLVNLGSRFRLAGYFKELLPALDYTWSRSSNVYGFSCQITPKATLTSAVLLEPGFLPSWRVGQEIRLTEYFALRSGWSANPDRFSFGLGFQEGCWQVDYALTSHEVLQLTHLFTLNFIWGRL